MEVNNKYIRFDWAVKRMLRDKANFAVLEGLITVLTGEVVKIEELLESEGNQESSSDECHSIFRPLKQGKDRHYLQQWQTNVLIFSVF